MWHVEKGPSAFFVSWQGWLGHTDQTKRQTEIHKSERQAWHRWLKIRMHMIQIHIMCSTCLFVNVKTPQLLADVWYFWCRFLTEQTGWRLPFSDGFSSSREYEQDFFPMSRTTTIRWDMWVRGTRCCALTFERHKLSSCKVCLPCSEHNFWHFWSGEARIG